MELTRVKSLKGEINVPGDKSISHRCIMFGALSKGITSIHNFLQGADCLSTIDCFRKLGLEIENREGEIVIHGKGLHGLEKPDSILDVGNSGTTIRLISGILAGQSFQTTLTGDESIRRRPMKRIMMPLSMMGAKITSQNNNDCTPIIIQSSTLTGIHYDSPIASAQVKSAVLLAGLYAKGITQVTEPVVSRNHTEIMLKYFGADVSTNNTTVSIKPNPNLVGQQVVVPGDISSAAYFIVAGLIVPNSEILIKNVGINPTRDGIIHVCRNMGADITLLNENTHNGEPTADILVRTSNLKATIIEGAIIPTLIDELPVIALLACLAEGTTIIKDAGELKVKESNRLDIMVEYLSAMGADVTATEDGMIIQGGKPLKGVVIKNHLDHRITMTFAIAALAADGNTRILGSELVNISYPNFFQDLLDLQED